MKLVGDISPKLGRRRQCTRKHRYKSLAKAENSLSRHRSGMQKKLNVYYCPYCFGHHIGHKKKET